MAKVMTKSQVVSHLAEKAGIQKKAVAGRGVRGQHLPGSTRIAVGVDGDRRPGEAATVDQAGVVCGV